MYERSIELLLELCSVSSASGDTDGLYRMTELLSRELTPLGFVADVSGGLKSEQLKFTVVDVPEAARVTSLPVPAVVGIQIVGGIRCLMGWGSAHS